MNYEFKLPDLGEGMAEAEIVEWLVKKGDKIGKNQDIVKVETAKAVADLPSPVSGKIASVVGKEGTTVRVNSVLAVIDTKDKIAAKEAEKFGVVGDIPAAGETNIFETIRRKELEEKKPLIKSKFDLFGELERADIKGVRKEGIKHLSKLKDFLLVTSMDEADVTKLWDLRNKSKLLNPNVKLTFLPYIIKACITALKEFPLLNSEISGEEIILKKYYNIGVAVSLEGNDGGLVVPVVKHADMKSVLDIANEIEQLASKVRDKKIDLQELNGGTFTITNYGSIGTLFATPLPNYPETAILGVGRIYEKLVMDKGDVVSARILPLSLTYDHRVVDGAVAAAFLNRVKTLLSESNFS